MKFLPLAVALAVVAIAQGGRLKCVYVQNPEVEVTTQSPHAIPEYQPPIVFDDLIEEIRQFESESENFLDQDGDRYFVSHDLKEVPVVKEVLDKLSVFQKRYEALQDKSETWQIGTNDPKPMPQELLDVLAELDEENVKFSDALEYLMVNTPVEILQEALQASGNDGVQEMPPNPDEFIFLPEEA
jgi:hypothetical protein